MPRTTIADVAQAAGVSVSTVSRALRGLDRVSPETRERIEQEAKRLHFSFSKSASSLASGKTMRVAVLLPNEISSWFNAHAFEGIYEVMSKAGYDIVPYIVWTQDDLDAFFQNLPGISPSHGSQLVGLAIVPQGSIQAVAVVAANLEHFW